MYQTNMALHRGWRGVVFHAGFTDEEVESQRSWELAQDHEASKVREAGLSSRWRAPEATRLAQCVMTPGSTEQCTCSSLGQGDLSLVFFLSGLTARPLSRATWVGIEVGPLGWLRGGQKLGVGRGRAEA